MWTRSRRTARPGSALKPFLYGLAFDQRLLTPASLLEDAPLEVATPTGLYRPHNYDEQFRGLVSVRTALASSLNVPGRARAGAGGRGADGAAAPAARASAASSRPGDFYGPSLALGSADVSLWEMVGAYRALAVGGVWSPLRMTAGEAPGESRRVYSEDAAFLVSSILADRDSRSVTFGLENPLATRFWTAVKTGTSKEMRDNWAVGYSRRYTVGVWVGNVTGEPMKNVSGVTGAAPIWLEVMAWLHETMPSAPPAPPPRAGPSSGVVHGPGRACAHRVVPRGYGAGHAPLDAGGGVAAHRRARRRHHRRARSGHSCRTASACPSRRARPCPVSAGCSMALCSARPPNCCSGRRRLDGIV